MSEGIIVFIDARIRPGLSAVGDAVAFPDFSPIQAVIRPSSAFREWIFHALKTGRVGLGGSHNR